jgi:nickel/cobalt exporter
MGEGLFYLISSFWLGALHAATPGHGKTIAASYIVGARGRPIDALVLGIFVTLSHTSGIVLVGILAILGSAWFVPHRVEAYLAAVTGVLVIGIGLWMLRTQRAALALAPDEAEHAHVHEHAHEDDHAHEHSHAHPHDHGHDSPVHSHGHEHGHDQPHAHEHPPAPVPEFHRHGWGPAHTHNIDLLARTRPNLLMLIGLGVAGGLLPDPGALAILLAAIASGKLVLGLFTVVVFSLGFASVLVVVGIVAARVGQVVLQWLSSRWIGRLQIGAALVIVGVGLVLTANAWRVLATLR